MGNEAPSREGEVLAEKYLLQRLLGSGGMGEVYLAENQHIQRTVAIKLLLPEHAADQHVVDRFVQEAKAANIVRHPNVVDVLDIGLDSKGTPFIVQEYLEGQDLESALTELKGRLPLEAALDMLYPVVEAIGYAHQRGVVHRDLKPSNIFLARVGTKVVAKVMDFGIAKMTKTPQARRMTAAGITMGTPAYIAPEVIRQGAQDADARSDVWSIGVVLYEVLSGSLPFDNETLNGLFASICLDEPAQLSSVAPHLPAEIVAVVMKCLIKDPEQRYATAALVARDLGVLMSNWRAPGSSAPPGALAALNKPAPPAAVDKSSSRPSPGGVPELPDLELAPPTTSSAPPRAESRASERSPAKIALDQGPTRSLASRPPTRQVRGVQPVRTSTPAAAVHKRREPQQELGARPILALVFALAVGGAAARLGAEAIVSFARAFPQYATSALGGAAAIVGLMGVILVRRLKPSETTPIGARLAGAGVLGYAAVFATASVQSAGIGLPNLAGVIAPVSLVSLGVGLFMVAASRAWNAWKIDRKGLLAALFVLAAIASGVLGGYSVAAMLKLY